MTNIANSILMLLGFTFAHATWNVSDLPKGDLLCPLAIVQNGDKRELLRFEAETQETAISNGKTEMARQQRTSDAWAFARDGMLNKSAGKVDVLVIDFWGKGMQNPATLIQRYEPYAKRQQFRLIGEPELVVDGKALLPTEAKESLAIVMKGIQSHKHANVLWSQWTRTDNKDAQQGH